MIGFFFDVHHDRLFSLGGFRLLCSMMRRFALPIKKQGPGEYLVGVTCGHSWLTAIFTGDERGGGTGCELNKETECCARLTSDPRVQVKRIVVEPRGEKLVVSLVASLTIYINLRSSTCFHVLPSVSRARLPTCNGNFRIVSCGSRTGQPGFEEAQNCETGFPLILGEKQLSGCAQRCGSAAVSTPSASSSTSPHVLDPAEL